MEEGDASADSNDALRYERPRPPAAPSRSAADVKANASAVSSPAPAEGAPAAAKPTQFAYAGQVHGLYRFDAAANGFKPVTDTGPFGVVLVGTCCGEILPLWVPRPLAHPFRPDTAGAGLAYSLIVYNAAKQYIVVTPVDGTVRRSMHAPRGRVVTLRSPLPASPRVPERTLRQFRRRKPCPLLARLPDSRGRRRLSPVCASWPVP